MSLWCECPDCGGSGEAFICENGLLRAQMMMAKSERQSTMLIHFLLGAMLMMLVLMIGTMAASGPSTVQAIQAASSKEKAANVITDKF